MRAKPIRWGICGTGGIANAFAKGLAALPDATLQAVGSRARETASRFARKHGARRAHASYEELAADPDVDVVYVATPHSCHKDNTLLFLDAGKHVLCEKPFALNRAQAETMVTRARSRGLFLMEAMWTRFLPVMDAVRKLLDEGAIGEVRLVQADFGFRTEWDPGSLVLNPGFGGGGLLDVGVYCVALASMVYHRPPRTLQSHACIGETGVDEQAALILSYDHGALALLSCAVRTETPQEAWIMGTEGMIRLHAPFWCARQATVHRSGRKPRSLAPQFAGNGYNYEAAAVHACLRKGHLESVLMPLDETLAILSVMDAARAQWGLEYPGETSL